MKISKLLMASLVIGASVLSAGLIGQAAEPSPTSPSSSPSTEPTSGGSLPSSSPMSTSTRSSSVLATCGSKSATFVYDAADRVPVGCHISTINAPPASILNK